MLDVQIWGVLNCTPDSFSDGGRFVDVDAAVAHALGMLDAGANVLDIGGEASSFHRPGVVPVDADEQVRRVLPVIGAIKAQRPDARISIDTRSAVVAAAAVAAGAAIVNDISAGESDPHLLPLVAKLGVEVVLMHRRDEPPGTAPAYADVLSEVFAYLTLRIARAEDAGIPRERVWVDPGLGFGKLPEHSMTLLRHTHKFAGLTGRTLVGASRKRFVAAIGQEGAPSQRVGGSLAAALWAATHGATAVRVHDVAHTAALLRMWHALLAHERHEPRTAP